MSKAKPENRIQLVETNFVSQAVSSILPTNVLCDAGQRKNEVKMNLHRQMHLNLNMILPRHSHPSQEQRI